MRIPLHLTLLALIPTVAFGQEASPYRAHDKTRPRPAVVTPGEGSAPPSDAIVLFDGKSLENWQAPNGSQSAWVLDNGTMHPTPSSGPILTKQTFGDVQLHIEWSSPTPPKGKGQGRGNSGVYLMTKYEVQVLDSFKNETYADGQAAALYGQNPPMVNACRPPGEWQTYEIIFRRPRFDKDGSLKTPAVMTVFHNGLLVQDHFELWGPTNWLKFDKYTKHEDALPIQLQDHGNPVRFRNIWIRNLPEPPSFKALGEATPELDASTLIADHYTGHYLENGKRAFQVIEHADGIAVKCWGRTFELVPKSISRFDFKKTDSGVEFAMDDSGNAKGMTVTITGHSHATKRE